MAAPVISTVDGHEVCARALGKLGVSHMFGVVGIPVTAIAQHAQRAGIRFIGMRNEQAAGYAACAHGYLTGKPAALLTVSGPGFVHGLAGLAHAQANCWPLLMISGSCDEQLVGRGAFQELDQMKLAAPLVKFSIKVTDIAELPRVLFCLVHYTMLM